MSRAAFVGFTRSHWPFLEPVVEALEADPDWEAWIVPGYDFEAQELGEPQWLPPSERVVRLRSLVSPLTRTAAPLRGDTGTLLDKWILETKRRFESLGLVSKYRDVRRELLEYLRTERPDVVVVPEESDYIRGRLASRIAGALGIRTVVLYPPYYHLVQSHPMTGPPHGDQFIVFTREMYQRLLGRWVDPARILLAESRHPFAASRGSKTLLFISQGLSNESRIVRTLATGALKFGLELKVREHPRRRLNDAELSRFVVSDSLDSLWPECLAVVAQNSSVLLHALRRDIPILIAAYGLGTYATGLTPAGISIQKFSSASELDRALAALQAGGVQPRERFPAKRPFEPFHRGDRGF